MRDFTIASGTASATGTINDNDAAPTVATIAASATEGSPAVFEFSLSNPSAVDTTIPLHSPMELLEVLITLLQRYRNRVPAGATTGTVSVPTTDTIEKIMKTLLLLLERLRLLEQSMIMMRLN
jgi:hypothetical protein